MKKIEFDPQTHIGKELMLVVKVESVEEFLKIKAFFDALGKDFTKIFRGEIYSEGDADSSSSGDSSR